MTNQTSTGEDTAGVPLVLPERDAEREPENIVEAWTRVLRYMPAIGKDNRMSEGGGYNFRSIEQFTAHAATLFARYGVAVFPRLKSIEYVDVGRTRNDALIVEARGEWEWSIKWAGDPAAEIVACTSGQGRDTSDKAANKASTAAFKYLLMPSLMISDQKDDPDQERIETAPPEPQVDPDLRKRYETLVADASKLKGTEYPAKLIERAKKDNVEKFTVWANPSLHDNLEEAEALVAEYLEAVEAAKAQDAAEAPQEPAKPKGRTTKAKPGSAVTPEELEAVQEHFPGAEPVNG